jgi:hypothetical protein
MIKPQNNTEDQPVDLSVEALLGTYAPVKTFDLGLPMGGELTFHLHESHSAKKEFEEARTKFIKSMMRRATEGRLPEGFIPLADLCTEDNLSFAFTLSTLCVSPGFDQAQALALSKAPALASYILDGITTHSANFLVQLKAQLLDEAKKD